MFARSRPRNMLGPNNNPPAKPWESNGTSNPGGNNGGDSWGDSWGGKTNRGW
ncbi:uncharacterized protein L3040_000690 [Drepanopeziza brunnea f. sp. 'multigermtubi']|uniref:uncharacterized protein n=1 Tax=Drepanopeziza brunnea f. sp. 'multigermtubi' TaxID=698441 RepID=UPI0023836E1A|nr:hypothetical protein L3040_000690 [Drepanopeziza brunnea f. sp. 'multigermtubi']